MSFNKLTWGVKESFRGYVKAAEGTITVSDGATETDDGTFVFAAAPGGDLSIAADGTATGSMKFEGSVLFEAHGGMLKTKLNDLGIEVGEDGLMLTCIDAATKHQYEIAKLELVEAEGDATTLRAEITMDGMYQIADNYPPGTELDPVILE